MFYFFSFISSIRKEKMIFHITLFKKNIFIYNFCTLLHITKK